ncbi:MAG: PilZ domain-containing protein [Bacillota bacterium]
METAPDRRAYFRLEFQDLTATMQIFEVGQNPISVEPRPVTITDLGGGGLSMQTDVDLPIRYGVFATFAFSLAGESFRFVGQLIRKVDDLTHYWYAVTFVDVEEAERAALVAALQRIQIERSRRARVQV